MMGVTHKATGLCAGAYIAWGVRTYVAPAPAPLYVAVAACVAGALLTVLAGRAALWPDLDHHNSTATNSLGLISGYIHEVVHRASCLVFDWTATAEDRRRGDFRGHRGLTHFAVTALGVGAVLGVLAWTFTEQRPTVALGIIAGVLVGAVAAWTWTDVLGALLGTIVAVVTWTLAPTQPRLALAILVAILVGLFVTEMLSSKAGLLPAAGVGFAVHYLVPIESVDWTLVGETIGGGIGLGVGLAVGTGMLAHSVGDCATKTGVPLLWPLRIRGRRYYPIHVRREGFRLHTGESEWSELKLRGWCWVALVAAVIGWVPGLWPVLWALIPWPWAVG